MFPDVNPPAKALLIAQLQKSSARPLIVIVRNNEAVDELLPVVQAYCELVGGCAPENIVSLPVRDVLPFQNLSPHPEIQEQRAIALVAHRDGRGFHRDRASCGCRVTGEAGGILFRLGAHPAPRRDAGNGNLLEHLNAVGYNSTDVVEMPGEYALRGGILDVYSPEADRPIRIELFGDEIESIRKFDPGNAAIVVSGG